MKQSGFGIAALVLGIAGIVLSCIGIGIIPCILGVIFSIVGMTQKGKGNGTAIAGLTCSLIGVVIFIFVALLFFSWKNEQKEVVQSNTVTVSDSTSQTSDDSFAPQAIGGIFLLSLIILMCYAWDKAGKDKKPKYTGPCPNCGSMRRHVMVEREVVVPESVKVKTSVNLNPLKPFTVFNHKEKVVQQEVSRNVSRFVCDDCGNIYG